MWMLAEYRPVTLFSLKSALATSSGARTLLIPTPYAVKMALLDAACRVRGVELAAQDWPFLRDLRLGVRPADVAVVNNVFVKILKPRRAPATPGSADVGPLGKTIAYREYVSLRGSLGLAFDLSGGGDAVELAELLTQVNYLGKRGSFMQLLGPPIVVDALPAQYLVLNAPSGGEFVMGGVMQVLDDCSPAMTFERASIYSGKPVALGRERILLHVVLPYRLVRSSRS